MCGDRFRKAMNPLNLFSTVNIAQLGSFSPLALCLTPPLNCTIFIRQNGLWAYYCRNKVTQNTLEPFVCLLQRDRQNVSFSLSTDFTILKFILCLSYLTHPRLSCCPLVVQNRVRMTLQVHTQSIFSAMAHNIRYFLFTSQLRLHVQIKTPLGRMNVLMRQDCISRIPKRLLKSRQILGSFVLKTELAT